MGKGKKRPIVAPEQEELSFSFSLRALRIELAGEACQVTALSVDVQGATSSATRALSESITRALNPAQQVRR